MDRLGQGPYSRGQLRDELPALRSDSLHHPGVDGQVYGEHPGQWIRPSAYTRWRLSRRTLRNVALVALAGLSVAAIVRSAQT